MKKSKKMKGFLFAETKCLLLKEFNLIPQIAIITGSGIKLFERFQSLFEIKYNKLPLWSIIKKQRNNETRKQGVKGHEGILKLYKIRNKNVLIFSGRKHLYEGLSFAEVVSNVRLAYELGVKKIIITNAAGGIDRKFKPGDLMLINGFIDLMQSTERGILSGIVQPPRQIRTKSTKVILKRFKKYIKTGVYAGVLGPSYETYAEVKFLQFLRASAVGMSTVPEMICAKSLGLDYAGISVISNIWDKNHKPSHKEVLKNVKRANKKLNELILKLLNYL